MAFGMTAGDVTGTRDIVEGLREQDTLNTRTFSADESYNKTVGGVVTLGINLTLAAVGSGKGRGRLSESVKLQSNGSRTGVAFLDRPIASAPEYGPWREALRKQGWVVVEAPLAEGTMATTEAATDAFGMLHKIVTIDPRQATYQALLHESRHVFHVEALAKQGLKAGSRVLNPAEAEAYKYERRVVKEYVSAKGKVPSPHDKPVVDEYVSRVWETAQTHESAASGGASRDLRRSLANVRRK